MRSAAKVLLLVVAPHALAACHKEQAQAPDQNIAIEQPMTNETMANADIETLPPDESSATSSNELANGNDNPDVNDVNPPANSH